ncbi:hypothetical protein AVEN_200257-1 [Araneus ventricosus]|uniref:Uncharacterized protein n=1 Tax=Araneus ventricosus TaxID=182803 RepID=A0A4Y2DR47_ARAVE|nr:hypothetical protein AVEN_200257-1 [Araneus ventricosus]
MSISYPISLFIATHLCKVDATNASSSDCGSKLRDPFQNSPRIAVKWYENVTKLIGLSRFLYRISRIIRIPWDLNKGQPQVVRIPWVYCILKQPSTTDATES